MVCGQLVTAVVCTFIGVRIEKYKVLAVPVLDRRTVQEPLARRSGR